MGKPTDFWLTPSSVEGLENLWQRFGGMDE